MPLMGSYYIGVSGLQTSQNALNTTAHNLSNIETTGYTRQQTLLEDRFYNTVGNGSVSIKQTGLGVEYAEVRQVRDAFLDLSYREEEGRKSFYDVAYETTNEIETLLGEMEGASFNTSITNFWTSVQELQKDPSSPVVQGQFVTTGLQFLERAQAVYEGLNTFQNNLNQRVYDMVTQINEYGNQIRQLNDAIMRTEIGVEDANDIRDARNLVLDKLSGLCDISYSEDIEGVVQVSIEGVPFVARDMVFEMGTRIDAGTGFYTPTWPWNDNVDVYDINKEISSDLDTDVGELRSALVMRGDRRANYTDLDETKFSKGYKDSFGIERIATDKSVILTTQAELDNLVNKIATTINDILCSEQGKDPSQRYYENKDDIPTELFERLGLDSRYEYHAADGGAHPVNAWYYVEEDTSKAPSDVGSMYTLSNLKINPDLLKEPTILSFLTADKQVDQYKADALAKAFQEPFGALNPSNNKEYSFTDYYDAMVAQVGNVGYVYGTIADSQGATVNSLENARQGVVGVSSNEELSNMIKFQNAYNAASRYINAVDAMLAHLIEKLA